MFQLPWVSRREYLAVVAAKSELIAYQRELIAELRNMLTRPVEVSVQLPTDFAVIQPAVVRAPARASKERSPELKNIDYAEIDESNLAQMKSVVDMHLGPRAKTANRWERRQVLNGVLAQIQAAREKKLHDRAQAADAVAPAQEPEQQVPMHIRKMIEDAEKGAA